MTTLSPQAKASDLGASLQPRLRGYLARGFPGLRPRDEFIEWLSEHGYEWELLPDGGAPKAVLYWLPARTVTHV